MALYAMANNGVVIPAERDGALYNFFTGNQDYVIKGIGNEFAITPSASSYLITLGDGEGIIGGRHVTEKLTDGANSMIQLEANANGYVVIRVNLDNPVGTEARLYATNALVKEDLNSGGTIRDLPLYQYTTDGNGVSSFVDVRNLSRGSNVICVIENGSLYMDYYNNGVVTRKQIGSTTPVQAIDATPSDVKSGKVFIGQGSEDPQTGTFTAQTKTVTPSESQQIVTPDSGRYLSQVTVNAMPSSLKYASILNANPLGHRTSSAIYIGNKNSIKYFITAWNGTFGLDGSDNNSTWTTLNDTRGSTSGSSSSASDNPTSVKSGNVSGYLYYRVWVEPYNNGRKGSASVALGN